MPRLMSILLVIVVLFSGCLQFSTAPTGQDEQTFCEWIRDLVANNSMPLETAARYYPECAPFEGEE